MNFKPMIDPKLLERVINASQDGIVIVEQEGDENILIYVIDILPALKDRDSYS